MTEAEVIYNYTVKGMSLDAISLEARERAGYANAVVHRYGIPTREKTTAWSGDSKGVYKAYLGRPKGECIAAILRYIDQGDLDGDWTKFYGRSTSNEREGLRKSDLEKMETQEQRESGAGIARESDFKRGFGVTSRKTSSDDFRNLSREVARWQLLAIVLAIVGFFLIWNVASGLWLFFKVMLSFFGACIVYGVVEYIAMLYLNKD